MATSWFLFGLYRRDLNKFDRLGDQILEARASLGRYVAAAENGDHDLTDLTIRNLGRNGEEAFPENGKTPSASKPQDSNAVPPGFSRRSSASDPRRRKCSKPDGN